MKYLLFHMNQNGVHALDSKVSTAWQYQASTVTCSRGEGITSVPRKFSLPWRRKRNLETNTIKGSRLKMEKTTHIHLPVRKMRLGEAK